MLTGKHLPVLPMPFDFIEDEERLIAAADLPNLCKSLGGTLTPLPLMGSTMKLAASPFELIFKGIGVGMDGCALWYQGLKDLCTCLSP